MGSVPFAAVLCLLSLLPLAPADASKVVTKDEVSTAIGAAIKEVKVEGAEIARYYAVNGKPFQEAVIVSVQPASSGTYDFALKNAKSTKYYKQDVAGFGEKAFWEEAGGAYGVLHVISGKTYVAINVGQSKAPQTYFDVAKALMAIALKRL